MMFSHRAAGFQREWKRPVLEAEQFTAWSFSYAGYDRDAYTARVKVTNQGSVVKEDLLQRGETGSYGRTNVNVEPLDYRHDVQPPCGRVPARMETPGAGGRAVHGMELFVCRL